MTKDKFYVMKVLEKIKMVQTKNIVKLATNEKQIMSESDFALISCVNRMNSREAFVQTRIRPPISPKSCELYP